MLVAIPSKGRASAVKSLRQLPTSAVLFVPEAEAMAYGKCNPGVEVVAVPDSVAGITRTRNWILDNTAEPRVVFVDDDLKTAGWLEALPFRWRVNRLTEDELLAEWCRLFELTEQMQYRIWGVATNSAPRAVYPYRPFIFHTYATASCMGMLNLPGFRFDESFPVKEDYELCLRCIKEDGGILGARHLFWENNHWTDEGGCKDYRSAEMETDCIERLIAMYPGMIRKVTRGGSEFSISLEF